VEVLKVRARKAKLILEGWGRIVLKYIRVRTSGIDTDEIGDTHRFPHPNRQAA
jgi:hypothetical protein